MRRSRLYYVRDLRGKAACRADLLARLGARVLATAGYKLRENFSDIDQYVGTASNAIIAVLVIGYVWRLWTHRHAGKTE